MEDDILHLLRERGWRRNHPSREEEEGGQEEEQEEVGQEVGQEVEDEEEDKEEEQQGGGGTGGGGREGVLGAESNLPGPTGLVLFTPDGFIQQLIVL